MQCIELDRECADICSYAINAIQKSSKFVPGILSLCADICDACGKECNSHDHRHCKDCAEACFRCADECRKVI
ncbi:four-helix bundle copper-binding protein [Bacillus sp. Marseille-Q1617]|uniref:four-helix bundle copper-binding protein n=1 Tax=Bacillus sp. Marseille-Q1617 TaxID=2736887 RepID=UPI0034C63391